MFIKKTAFALLYVTSSLARNIFIDEYNNERAELFKKMDSQVPTVRVTISDYDFEMLKIIGSSGVNPSQPQQQQTWPSTINLSWLFSTGLVKQKRDNEQSIYYEENPTNQQSSSGQRPIVNIQKPIYEYDKSSFPMQSPYEPVVVERPLLSTDSNYQFSTKNATMTFEIDDEVLSFDKITFKLGGSSSRVFAKQGYNIKIRGGKELYGRTEFKIRPDSREATYLRSKLACDIHNRLNLPSISANYVQLYINDNYMGFYVFMENIKLSWIKYKYGEENTTHLYQCRDIGSYLTVQSSDTECTNENEDVTDHTEWIQLLTRLDKVNSAEDI